MYSLMPNGYYIAPDMTDFLHGTVAPGYYTVAFDGDRGCFYLAHAEPFTLVKKIYGNSLKHADRILDTFKSRVGINTAAAFEGVKGSGKTLLMKRISKTFVEQDNGIVLIVNTPFSGDAFNSFIQSVSQPKIVIFDEFEKVYSERDKRNGILTLLDGTFASHTLFIITTNTDMYKDSSMEYFSNRPGRVYFNINFAPVDLPSILEYCADNLNDKSRIDSIKSYVSKFRIFNMDMLSVLVHEMNNSPELSLSELSEFLNIKPDISMSDLNYDFQVKYKGVDCTDSLSHCLNSSRVESFFNDDCSPWNIYTCDGDDLKGIDASGQTVPVGEFDIYITKDSCLIQQNPLTRVVTITSNDLVLTITPIYTDSFSAKRVSF